MLLCTDETESRSCRKRLSHGSIPGDAHVTWSVSAVLFSSESCYIMSLHSCQPTSHTVWRTNTHSLSRLLILLIHSFIISLTRWNMWTASHTCRDTEPSLLHWHGAAVPESFYPLQMPSVVTSEPIFIISLCRVALQSADERFFLFSSRLLRLVMN